jgi:hypothetical protein
MLIRNFIILVLSKFRVSLFTANNLSIRDITLFHNMQIISKFLLEIMTLMSSANIIGAARVFFVGRRSFIYIMKSKGPKIDPCGIPCSIVPQIEKVLWAVKSSLS